MERMYGRPDNGLTRKARVFAVIIMLTFFISAGNAFAQMPDTLQMPKTLQASESLQKVMQEAYLKFKDVKDGATADYIPELAKVPADLFGLAIVTAKGEVFTIGDVDYAFSIQSVSKPFTAALVMQQQGAQAIADKIGVEPTGLKFNAILATQIIPQVSVNPLVNSGAIASVSMVQAGSADERFNKILGFFNDLSGAKLSVIEDVYKSEAATNQRNRAHGYILAASDRIYSDPMEAVDVYTKECSIGVTAKQLAVMGATLANGGINPVTGKRVIESQYVPKILALMMMAGFYNESGQWAFTAGLPAKDRCRRRHCCGSARKDGHCRILTPGE